MALSIDSVGESSISIAFPTTRMHSSSEVGNVTRAGDLTPGSELGVRTVRTGIPDQ